MRQRAALVAVVVLCAGCGDDGPGLGTYFIAFITWCAAAIAVSSVADRWGRSGGGYFLLSLFFSPLFAGLVLVARGEETKRCGYCRAYIPLSAPLCRFCGATAAYVPPPQTTPAPPSSPAIAVGSVSNQVTPQPMSSAAPATPPPQPLTVRPRGLVLVTMVLAACVVTGSGIGVLWWALSDADPPARAPARPGAKRTSSPRR